MLILMQGVPGSGKSTKAKEIAKLINAEICSTDSYFYEDGEYKFDPTKLGEYHKRNFEQTIFHLKRGKSVIVDNTNIKKRDVKKYIDFAEENNIAIVVVRCDGNYKSVHNVPENVIERMRREMEILN